MKKILAAVAAVLVSATLLTAAPANAAVPTGQYDNLYITTIRDEAPELYGVSRKDLIKLAKTICKTLRTTSYGMVDIAEMGVESGFSENAAAAIVAGAVAFYCPDQENNY